MLALTLLLSLPQNVNTFNPGPNPMLMRSPTLSRDSIVFSFAGDLWKVSREGGRAVRLTSSPGNEQSPRFSPDGNWIAFSGQYDGNTDVFVIPAKGGIPKRLTFHPSADNVSAWAPDGKSVVYSSSMLSNTDLPRLFSVPIEGGIPRPLPFPSGTEVSYSPDGSKIAYVPYFQWQNAWKRYRGGQTLPIWIANLSDSKVREVPRKNTNDKNPMWIGSKIYYLSDPTGPVGMYCYDTVSNATTVAVAGDGFDLKSADAGPGAIVYEKLGSIGLYDLEGKTAKKVDIQIDGDFPEFRPQFKSLADNLGSGSISPSGARVVFEARGRIFTIPASKGNAHEISSKDGVANRYVSWSPDGKTIAFFSDESGEYKLVLHEVATDKERVIDPGQMPAYYFSPSWSPDSKKIAYTDNRHNLWVLDVASGRSTLVDTFTYEDPTRTVSPNWSKDSNWLTWHRDLENHLNAIFLYDVASGKKSQVTDGLSNARFPIFDKNGSYLYFVASTNTGPSAAWLDLSSYDRANITSSVYAVALRKDVADPNSPESDEEGAAPAAPKSEAFSIDLDGIGQRIVTLPIPSRNYIGTAAATDGSFFYLDVSPLATITSAPLVSLYKFDLGSRREMVFARQVQGFDVTPKGDKMLLIQGPMWSIVPTAAPPQPGQGAISLAELTAKVDPAKEWQQMYHEAWRIERDYLYDPNFHGINLRMMEARYKPFLAGLRSRADLNYLFEDMLGEISIGHMFISGGDIPGIEGVPGGLLGADYSIENNRYRLARVFNGESWNPGARAPLTQPGVSAVAGEYILAIDGRELTAKDDIYQRLEGKAGKQVRIKIGPNPNGTGARDVTVVPTGSEFALRTLAWEEDNRRKVDQLSGGKLGYVHIPDTNIGGWVYFNRYYYAQIRKDGMIIDERFNHGGQVDDYMVEQMSRPLTSAWTSRYGEDFYSPAVGNFGPKVMIVNQFAGSGGDYFPWHFKQRKVGPVVGKRTWGGLVGILVFPSFVDGGSITAPNVAFYNPNGEWEVENHGVSPDVEVELDPAAWRQGRDTQLEKAVEVALDRLKTFKRPVVKKPPYIDKSKIGG
ncbi:MAG TPA: PDZ domain-containing protein [Fimbriimonadaceae bacterium]|nr:PDZ domain-containing protein [Fimbriimonadaceae bacterium]